MLFGTHRTEGGLLSFLSLARGSTFPQLFCRGSTVRPRLMRQSALAHGLAGGTSFSPVTNRNTPVRGKELCVLAMFFLIVVDVCQHAVVRLSEEGVVVRPPRCGRQQIPQ